MKQQQPKLYIRACYPKLFEKLQQYERVLLTGTPGIGKVGGVGLGPCPTPYPLGRGSYL